MRIVFSRIACVLVVMMLFGCGLKSEGDGPKSLANQAEILAVADAADGSVDSVVHLCAVCALSMDGDEQFSSTYADYTFHHCSAHCKETFDYDPVAVLARLE